MAEYRNPQSEPGADKRMLIALLGVFVVLGLLQFILPKPPQPPPNQQQQQQQTQQQAAPPANTPAPSPAATPASKRAAKTPEAAPKIPVKKAEKNEEYVLDNGIYRITFTNRGAVVKSWSLTEKNRDGSYKYTDNSGKQFDLVNPTVAPQLGYPLSFFTYDKPLEKNINEGLYVVSSQSSDALTFEYSDGDVLARKVFRVSHDHILNVETEVTRDGQRVQAFPQWPSGLGDQLAAAAFTVSKIHWAQNGNIERQDPVSGGLFRSKKWVSGGQTLPGPYNWAATADRYFADRKSTRLNS